MRPALRFALPFLLVRVLGDAPSAHAESYEFDPRRTEVRFSYRMGFATQRGRFTKITGTLNYDDAKPETSIVTASIAAASLATGDALVDSQLKGDEFFSVATAPLIAFNSLEVEPRSPTSAKVAGKVTIRGITQPVILDVRIEPHDDPALRFDSGTRRFVATATIQRSAFNMTAYESFVGDNVNLVIDATVRPRRKRR